MDHIANITYEFVSQNVLKDMELVMSEHCEVWWYQDVTRENARHGTGRNKLRTYATFKEDYSVEPYVQILSRGQRRALAQFRAGVAPIRLETGRYEGLQEHERVCPHCRNVVENEAHVVLVCDLYQDIRGEILRFSLPRLFK